MNFTKILAGIVILGMAILTWMLFSEQKRADYLANYVRTQAARAARHSRKNEPEPEPEEEPEAEEEPTQTQIEKHEAGI